jgi:hypothetical protein
MIYGDNLIINTDAPYMKYALADLEKAKKDLKDLKREFERLDKIISSIDRWLESQVSLKGEQDEPIK